jgi:hypothetical protein
MADRVQSLQSHARWLPPFHFFVLPVLLVNAINAGRHLYLDPTRGTLWGLVVALALLTLALMARTMAITVQDRVIRVEERQRLRQLLPADLQPHINTITRPQLVGLRFASDAELTDLVRDIVAGKITTQKEIKSRVKSWQPDWLRA